MTAWIQASDVQVWLGGSGTINQAAAGELAQLATDAVRGFIERDVALQTNITESLDSNGTDYVLLTHWPIQSVSSVAYNGVPMVAAAFNRPGWRIDSFNQRKLSFPGMGRLGRGALNLTVTYTAGYDLGLPLGMPGALPGDLVQALKLTAAAIYNAQAADPNLMSESTAGVFSGSFVPTGVGAVPPGARSLLTPFRRVSP